MQTTLDARSVTTIDTGETAKFTIAASGKAFKILIDRLYSDKVKAVVRELWTNAYDSHIMAGCVDKPFDCHLPTSWEPEFSVRDYGVGMSHDQIMHLYTTVFGSTKDSSNEQVGAFGLGSKSPFAYTDTFTVTAFDGAEARMYSAYIGGDHVPRISLMGQTPSEEPRGIMVSFPVKVDDCEAFKRAAGDCILGFDVRPNISGQSLLVGLDNPIFSGNGWKIYATGTSYARQGCVIYPISAGAVLGSTYDQRALLNASIILDFAIGELDVAASREALGYDERTSQNILARVDAVSKELSEQIGAQLDASPTYWDAMIAYGKLAQTNLPTSVKRAVQSTIKWRGRNLLEFMDIDDALAASKYNVKVTIADRNDLLKKKPVRWEPTTRGRVNISNVAIYLEDATKPVSMPYPRLKHHWLMQGRDTSTVLWVKADPKSTAFKRFYVTLGRPPLIMLDENLPKPPKDSTAAPKKPVRARLLQQNSLDETDVDVEAGGVYFNMYRGDPVGATGMSCEMHNVRAVWRSLIALGKIDATTAVYGIPASLKRVVAAEGWVNFWDIAKEVCAEGFDPQAAVDVEEYREIAGEVDGAIGFINQILDELPILNAGPAHDLVTFVREAHAAASSDALKKVRTMRDLWEHVNGRWVQPVTTVNPGPLVDAFKARYPLAEMIIRRERASRLNQDELKALVDYVNQIDFQKVQEHSATDYRQAA